MAQLVEHNLAKVGVAGSSPVVRSIAFPDRLGGPFSAKWPSGKAEACKAFTPGSNPGFASRQHPGAPAPVLFYICGHGSVGRAQPCQGWGRGFEPRCPLQISQPLIRGAFSYCQLLDGTNSWMKLFRTYVFFHCPKQRLCSSAFRFTACVG